MLTIIIVNRERTLERDRALNSHPITGNLGVTVDIDINWIGVVYYVHKMVMYL